MSRAAIAAMTAYTLELREADIKLNQNESPEDVPAEWKEELFRRVANRSWNRYPDFELNELRSALARANGLESDQILVGNGSNELLAAAVATFVGPGTPVVIPRPTFTLYEKLVAIAGGTLMPIEIDPATGLLPLDEMVAAANPSAVVIVCSPNNPTGGVLPEGGLDRLLATGATVFWDRAYGDFHDAAMKLTADRLVTFSTFSKAWGLAALRIGWLASTTATCREIRKVKLPYSLNIISEAAAILALENPWLRDRNVTRVQRERSRMLETLESCAFPSQANFILFRARPGAFEEFCARGILIRKAGDHLRVSIGTPQQNDAFLTAWKELA